MSQFLRRVAKRPCTAVTLQDLYKYGVEALSKPEQRIRNAQFLHHEVQIRIAQRVVQLESLPLGLPETRSVQDVVGWYESYFEKVVECDVPEDEESERAFTDVLKFILQDNSEVIEHTSRGVVEIRNRMKGFTIENQQIVDK